MTKHLRNTMRRRKFLKQSATLASVPLMAGVFTSTTRAAANDKLKLGVIGVAGRGADNLAGVATEEIVALVDVDLARVGAAKSQFPKANVYQDYRKMFEREKLDAVVISTPDHSHALPAVIALRSGLHVYCEKPLAHSVFETRAIREAAAKSGKITQLGTQIHAGGNYHRVVEKIKDGAIGTIERVFVWFEGRPRPSKRQSNQPVPKDLDYDLWVGPAPFRPYDKDNCHFNWRWWWEYGGGMLEDFGCHYMDLPFWALDLGAPSSVAAKGAKDHNGENDVPGKLVVDYEFPARGALPPVHLTWSQGGERPEEAKKYELKNAVLFVGSKGELLSDYSHHRLFPKEKFEGYAPPRSIPDSIGHQQDWLAAIRANKPATCPFDRGGELTEAVLLGNVAYRAGQATLKWDSANLKVINNNPSAAELIRPEFRKGWEL